MTDAECLETKYDAYAAQGHSVFLVTLSTLIRSEAIARSSAMESYWQHEFIYRALRKLPKWLQDKADHDHVVEKSPDGIYHFHGFLALKPEAARRFSRNGVIDRQIRKDLDALAVRGKYRPFAVTAWKIDAMDDRGAAPWARYITKTHDYIYNGERYQSRLAA